MSNAYVSYPRIWPCTDIGKCTRMFPLRHMRELELTGIIRNIFHILTLLFRRLNLVHELTRWPYQTCGVETIVLMRPFIQFYVCPIKHPIDMDTQSRSCDRFSYPNGSRIPPVVWPERRTPMQRTAVNTNQGNNVKYGGLQR